MLSDNDTQNKKYIRNEDLSQTSPIAIENPNPPPRKDRTDDSSRGDSRHSSGKDNSDSQGIEGGSTSTTHTGGSSAHTYANPLRFLYL